MKYAIITPTYINHFKFIKPYLKSYIKYVKDKDNIHLYFIISKAEKDKFNKITDRYKDQCNITVLYFEELLGYFGVKEFPENLLKKYGRFTFQTFKKLYALLFIPEEKSLVLDSESMWVRKTNMSELFEKFFSKPVIYGSLLDKKLRIGPAFNQMVKNVDFLLKKTCPYWFLENYMWFYEKNIVKDLVSSHGMPLEMAEKLKEKNKNMKINENILSGIFEITLYQNFIYQNLKKYNYHFVDMSQKIKKSLPKNDYNLYEKNFYDKCNGSCGLTEHTCLLLTNSNYKGLAGLFKELNLNIIRCDYTDINNYRYQKKFLDIVKPNILASSQNHWFGLNNKPFNRLKLIIQNDKNYKKLIKHGQYFYQPLKSFFDWLSQPVAVIFYFIKLLLNMIKNIKSFL